MADYSSTSLTYIGDGANIEATLFNGSSITLNEPGLHGPTANLDFGADVKVVTNNMYFNENLRLQIGIRPIETLLVPVLYYVGEALGPILNGVGKGLVFD